MGFFVGDFMAIEQVSLTVSDSWTKLSVGDCVVQTPSNQQKSIEFAISDTQPGAGVKAFAANFGEPTTIGALGSSVWVRRKAVKQTPGITVSAANADIVVARAPF